MKTFRTKKVTKEDKTFRIFHFFCGKKKYYIQGGILCHEETEQVQMEWDR